VVQRYWKARRKGWKTVYCSNTYTKAIIKPKGSNDLCHLGFSSPSLLFLFITCYFLVAEYVLDN
jgi:hypothetical protein